jgi:hypothetical protein
VPLKTILIVFSAVFIVGCSKPKDAPPAIPLVSTAETPLYAYAQTNDLRVAPQFTKGWYGVEDGAWRWMSKESETVLKNPQTYPAQFEVRLALPKGTVATVGGPVTLSVLINGKALGEETYSKDGGYIFQKTVAPGVLGPEPVKVTLRVNKVKAPVPGGDIRELGAIIEGLGFK